MTRSKTSRTFTGTMSHQQNLNYKEKGKGIENRQRRTNDERMKCKSKGKNFPE